MNPTQPPHSHALTPYSPAVPGGYAIQNLDVSSGLLVAHEGAGVLMPQVCVSCGSSERGGELLNRKLYWSPKWTYATLLISPLLFFLCYYAARKNLQAQYYLCPTCADRARKVRMGTSVGWLALLGSVGVAFALASAEVVILVSFVVFCMMLVLALIGRAPLRITSYQEGRFILQTRAAAYAERIGAPLQIADGRRLAPYTSQPPSFLEQMPAPHTSHAPHMPPSHHDSQDNLPPHYYDRPSPPQRPAPRLNPDGTDGDV